MFSASLYNCQLLYTQFLQFYIIIVIVKCNTSVFTLVLFTLQYCIDGQIMVINDCNKLLYLNEER